MSGLNAELLAGIDVLFQRYTETAPFAKIRTGRIVNQVGASLYSVSIDGNTYTVPSIGNTTYNIDDVVKVVIPANRFADRFLLPSSGAVLDSTDAKLYEKCVAYVDSRIAELEAKIEELSK